MPGDDILIVEDSLEIQDYLAFVLDRYEAAYRSAPNARLALAHAEAGWPGLVLLDVELPGDMDGWALWDRLKAMSAGRPLRVILLTGTRTADLRAAADQRGALAVLYKPVSEERLLRQLRQAFQAESEPDNPKP